MKNIQTFNAMAMAAILGAGVMPAAGAEQANEASPPPADTMPTYGIRPANPAVPAPASPEQAAADRTIPPSSARSSEIKHAGDIRYVSGGVGESERTELNALSSQFNLHLLFATQGSGEYLSAVRVTILDARRATILTAESKGPWFFTQLPPGDYQVEVTPTGLVGQGQTQRRNAHLDGSNQSRMDFYWK